MGLARISWREFGRRRLRTGLTISSIAIGVAAILSISIASTNARTAQKSLLQTMAGKSDLEIVSDNSAGFDVQWVHKIAAYPGVAAAIPSLKRNSVMFVPDDRKARVQLVGIDPNRDSQSREYEIIEGENLSAQEHVLLDQSFARSLQLKPGSPIKFLTRSGVQEAIVVGLIKPTGTAAIVQGSTVLLPMATAQNWFRARNKVDSIQLIAQAESNVDQLEKVIAASLPQGIQVRKPLMRSQMADETTLSTQQGLKLATGFALAIAVFIIYNTFQMSVGERRRQLGVLRALGSTQKQLEQMILREALLLGMIGTLLGCVLGYFGAMALGRGTSRLMGFEFTSMNVDWISLLEAIACGLGISLIGAWVPARKASQLSAAEAMKVVAATDFEKPDRRLTWTGLVLTVVGIVWVAGCIQGWFIADHSTLGSLIGLLGLILMLPHFLGGAAQGVRYLLGPWFAVEGRLAARQLLRHRYRSSWTIAVLFIAMSTGLGMASTILDNIRDIQGWYQQAIVGDFFVRAAMPDMTTGQAADMPDDLEERLRNIPGIEKVDSLRLVNARSGENAVVVVARIYVPNEPNSFDLTLGNERTVMQQVSSGGVVIGTVLAQRTQYQLGDMIPIETPDGTHQVEIVGIANDYLGGGLTVYMNRSKAEQLLKIEGADAYIVQAQDDKLVEVKQSLETLCDETGLLLQSYAELVATIHRMMNGVIGGLWAVLALGSIIAAFGLVNTLAMNILEQSREIAMLRVIAMTRMQVRKLVLAQAMMMGLIGLIPGALLGILVGYLTNLSTLPVLGHAIAFTFRPGLILAAFAIELLLVVAAALLPAQRAANMKLSHAVQYE